MGVYVDDLFVAGSNPKIIQEAITKLNENFTLVETEGFNFLGMEINEDQNGFTLSQEKYVDKILVKFGLSECNPVKTPCDINQNLNDFKTSKLSDIKTYQEMIGSLMYLSIGTRSHIAFSVSNLSQYSTDPREIHLTALKRVFRYLKGTKN